MTEESEFISRTGSIGARPEEVFSFAADMRNFTRFTGSENISDWNAERDSCSFEIPMGGKVRVSVTEREPFSKIRFEGQAMNSVEFRLWIQLKEADDGTTRFRLVLRAVLNPLFKMMVSGKINEYLEKLIGEIERFSDWTDVAEDTQSP
jgi:carbon monoxide dehydrogenase subunit G